MVQIENVIEKISQQQEKYDKKRTVYLVGEQLKDICRGDINAAEIVLQDLDKESMSISNCEEKIKEYALAHGGGADPEESDKIIREFYGIHKSEQTKQSGVVSLMDLI